MRKWQRNGVLVLAAVLLSLAAASPALAGPPLHQASGGGSFVAPEGPGPGGEPQDFMFAFTARQLDASGNAEGQFEHHNLTKGHMLHMEILFMKVVGNDVWLGGIVTESNHLEPGAERIVRLRDNGEGANAAGPDQRSRLANQPPINALGTPPLPLFPLDSGNIQVR